jgi:aspartyl-tRNA(Asn)/glutamyl-tRNA(Gln) amidotransferase subunit B
VWDVPLGNYFEGVARLSPNPKAAANWLINNLRAKLTESGTSLAEVKFSPGAIAELVRLVEAGTDQLQNRPGRVHGNVRHGRASGKNRRGPGLSQVSDTGAIEKFCDEAIAANPGPAADFKAGKAAALNFLKGQVMKLSRGKANPALVGEVLERKLRG